MAETENVDAILERAERNVGRLADGRLPLEALVTAYEEAGRLIAEAEERTARLRAAAEIPGADS